MRRPLKRRISTGTIVMLVLSALVLTAFGMLLPKLTGNADVRVDASKLAVAIDSSLSKLSAGVMESRPRATQSPVPPNIFVSQSTTVPTTAPATPPPRLSFTLCAAGSIKMNTTVQKALTDENTYHFDLLTDQMVGAMQADLSLATLENNVIPNEKPTDSNLPAEALTPIRALGINALSLGYTGILDSGMDGLAATRQSVQAAGITPYGAYTAISEHGTLLNLNGVRVALLAFQSEVSSTGKKRTTPEERALAFSPAEIESITTEISDARTNGAQVIVVSLCWGKAGATAPTKAQIELAQAIADAGADVILGTHSGALQTVEILTANRGDGKYHPTLCAYSLGNLFTYEREKRTGLAGMLLRAEVVYDPSTGCVAFDKLGYTPTYSWRDKIDGKMRYRVLQNAGTAYPDFVDKDQKGVMERCYTLVDELMKETVFPMVTP